MSASTASRRGPGPGAAGGESKRSLPVREVPPQGPGCFPAWFQKPRLRPVPYPYRAMMAVCSDLDRTPDLKAYLEVMRFLNTGGETSMGRGAGLETGNSIYFDMPGDQFSYWNAGEPGREAIRALIGSGHVDCLHSYGDLAMTRRHAARALEDLERHGLKMRVWVDHGKAPSNFGSDIMEGSGDLPGAEAYHADLTCAHGIRYVWRGRVTSVVGQETRRRLRGICRRDHPLASARTVCEELAKGLLGSWGYEKYAMHRPNRIFRDVRLRDGSEVVEFIRANPCWGGVGLGATADGIHEALSEDVLDELVRREGTSILYTHLGRAGNPGKPLGEAARRAFERLSGYCREGKILVTTTRRLLGFHDARARAVVTACGTGEDGGMTVRVSASRLGSRGGLAPADFQGMTVYVPDPGRTRLLLNGDEVPAIQRNGPDHTGRESVTIPWRRLEFPAI